MLTTESLGGCVRLTEPDSWERVGDFPWQGHVVIFANPRDSREMLWVCSLEDAMIILAEAPPFDFLLTAQDCSFLFAHDQYDNLFGCGIAKEFLGV